MGSKLTCCLKPNASPKRGRHCGWGKADDVSDVYKAGSRNSVAAPPVPAALEPAELSFQACEGHHVLHISDLEMPEELASELIPSDHPRASTIFLKKSQMDVRGKRKNYSYHPGFSALLPHKEQQETVPDEYFNRDPDPESIYRFISPFFSATQLRAEYAITTLIYLERLLIYAEIDICPTNWKRIVLGAIVLASKYLHDLAIWNADFCNILRSITVEDMNEMERHFLDLLEFRLNVSASVYAKYYFDLRSLARDHGLPSVFAPLQKERAQNLEAISRYCKNKKLCRVAIKKSSSADNITNMQHANAILS
ncbi:cyclin-Y-like protein 1 isoform X2 [Pteronotus mesoamericanus]|uniref:cyclin-Y-like protein 1 isoform X2 n=1 Tax=Pteronotus mesoamericanus TaxID=1884717 RepID=UPI0023EDB554|nr:cyclin-Y-like protein 1 isoform X2 [Pteronotus parnellii mesoamericanus]